MATLILGAVGRIFGGPLGGIVGSALGGIVDRGIFGGGGKPRELGRIGNLAVQSAAYGEPIPFIAGRMRAAGNLLWTSGIKETSTRSGGGKRSGPATTTYTYSASFAVGLAGREIAAVGRIWADGKLIRGAGGGFLTPVTMRLHRGSESQAVDPLVAAAEGAGGAPAYRGIAYVVFEDMPLADFGNRIPNLTFEIIADAVTDSDAGGAIAGLGLVDGRKAIGVEGVFPAMTGYFAGRSGSIADAIEALVEMSGAAIVSTGGLVVRGRSEAVVLLPSDELQARIAGDERPHERRKRMGGNGMVGAVEIAFYDTSRDFQPGLQRARRDSDGGTDHQSLACAMSPAEAKTLATKMLARSHGARRRMTVRLSWRFLAVQPGVLVRTVGDDIVWRVREARFEAFVLSLDLERVEVETLLSADSDGGRALAFDDRPAGPTSLRLLDLPPMPGEMVTVPRLWVAAAGASASWRRAAIMVSADDGESYDLIGIRDGGVVIGGAEVPLQAGLIDTWDRIGSVVVDLVADGMWLEGRTEAAVLAGANLALLGSEVIQFSVATQLAPGRFRLSGLLRGRRGTESAVGSHVAGEDFVMLEPQSLLSFDPPVEAIGRRFRFRAAGIDDGAAMATEIVASGRALRPLSPAHLRLCQRDGEVEARWIRRSRVGFGWHDFVEAPLGERTEAYRVEIAVDGAPMGEATVAMPTFSYPLADHPRGGGAVVTIRVAQLSDVVGPGEAASASLVFE